MSASTKGSDIVVLQISSNGPSINYFVEKRAIQIVRKHLHLLTDTTNVLLVGPFIKDSQIKYMFEFPPRLKIYKKYPNSKSVISK